MRVELGAQKLHDRAEQIAGHPEVTSRNSRSDIAGCFARPAVFIFFLKLMESVSAKMDSCRKIARVLRVRLVFLALRRPKSSKREPYVKAEEIHEEDFQHQSFCFFFL